MTGVLSFEQKEDQWLDKHVESHHRRKRIPRKAENVSVATVAEHGRLSRLHCDLIEQHFDTKFGKHRFDQIVLPHRNAA